MKRTSAEYGNWAATDQYTRDSRGAALFRASCYSTISSKISARCSCLAFSAIFVAAVHTSCKNRLVTPVVPHIQAAFFLAHLRRDTWCACPGRLAAAAAVVVLVLVLVLVLVRRPARDESTSLLMRRWMCSSTRRLGRSSLFVDARHTTGEGKVS